MSATALVHARPAAGAPSLIGLVPSSYTAWLLVIAYVVLAKLLSDTIAPITFRGAGQRSLFEWTSIAMSTGLGLVGVWCARRTGFPDAWGTRISSRQRLLLPALMGAGLACVAVGLDVLTRGTETVARITGESSFNIDFPGSLLAYSAGAVDVELQYRLFTLPFLLWLISSVLLRGGRQWVCLLVLGTISAAFEPVIQGIGLTILGAGVITPVMLTAYMATALPMNATQVIVFRKYGLLAPIALRLGDYAIWHIVYGNFLHARLG